MKVVLKNVNKCYKDKHVLKDANLEVTEPGIVRIPGPSGSGKTTLLRLVAGLEKADSGEVTIEGKTLMMFQSYRLFPERSILENVTFGRKKLFGRAIEILERLGLSDEKDTKIKNASGGMAQRTAFARLVLFADDADILLADEPISAQDKENAEKIMDILRELSQKKIVLLVSHS